MNFDHPCPGCGTTHLMHELDCEWDHVDRTERETAYVRILGQLVAHTAVRDMHDVPLGVEYEKLRKDVEAEMDEQWWDLYDACLHELKRQRYVQETEEDGLWLVKPDERDQQFVIPVYEPIQTVYEHGPIDGCKDYAVFSMVSWCEMNDFSWDQAKAFVTEWLEETGGWEEQSWGEHSIDELLESKYHVFDQGLGWRSKAENAKSIIERSDHEPRIDAQEKAESVDGPEYYDP